MARRKIGERWTVSENIIARQGKRGRAYYVQTATPDGKKEFTSRDEHGRRFGDNLDAAKAFRDRLRGDIRAGHYVERNDKTVREAVADWINYRAGRPTRTGALPAPSTRQHHSRLAKLIDAATGDGKLQELTPARVNSLISELRTLPRGKEGATRPAGAQTQQQVLIMLKAVCKREVSLGNLAKNPCHHDDIIRPSKQRIRRCPLPEGANYVRGRMVLTAADVEELLGHISAKGEDYRQLWRAVTVLWQTGLRRGELLALRWDRVYLDARAIWVTRTESGGEALDSTKTANSDDEVVIDSDLAQLLRRHKKEQIALYGAGNWFVFPSPRGPDTVMKGPTFTSGFQTALKGTRFEAASPHDLRHAHASYLISLGGKWNTTTVAKRLRDTPETVAKVYGHPTDNLSDAIEAAFSRPRSTPSVVGGENSQTSPPLRVIK